MAENSPLCILFICVFLLRKIPETVYNIVWYPPRRREADVPSTHPGVLLSIPLGLLRYASCIIGHIRFTRHSSQDPPNAIEEPEGLGSALTTVFNK